MTCVSAVGCNRVGTYVASILPKKTAESNSSFSDEDFTKDGAVDHTIRPDNAKSGAQDRHPKREGFLTAPGGEGFGNGYDQEEYQQMMAQLGENTEYLDGAAYEAVRVQQSSDYRELAESLIAQ